MWSPPILRRSRATRVLLLAGLLVTTASFFWIRQFRASMDTHYLQPIFFALFVFYDYWATLYTLFILLCAAAVPAGFPVGAALAWLSDRVGLVAGVATLVLCAGSLLVYRAHPLSMDEYTMLFQSRAFAAGRLNGEVPPFLIDWLVPLTFQNVFLNVSHASGKIASAYWPSFALLLTPFAWLGVPWACNPVLSGATILALHRIALRLFADREAAGLTVLFTIASPVFFANGISYYSMTAHLLASTLFVLLLMAPTSKRCFLAGLVGSVALTLHNPVPHLLFAAPWWVWIASRRERRRLLVALAAGYVPLGLLLGVGWFWFSGRLLWDGLSSMTPAPAAGLAAEVPTAVKRLTWAFSLPTETVYLARAVGLAKLWLWAVPGLLLLACVGAARWRRDPICRALAASAATTLLGYVFVSSDQGHGWGYRFFHSAWLTLPLLATAALVRPSAAPAEDRVDEGATELRTFAVACALLTLVVAVPVRGVQIHSFVTEQLNRIPSDAAADASLERVVFIEATNSFYAGDLVQNDPFLRGGVTRMVSHGYLENERLMKERFPELRRAYVDRRGEIWTRDGAGH